MTKPEPLTAEHAHLWRHRGTFAVDCTKEIHVCEAFEAGAAAERAKVAGLREVLAAIEHEQWITWSQDLMSKELLTGERIARWQDLWVPYADLSEEVKDHDRKWADQVLAALSAEEPPERRSERDFRALIEDEPIVPGYTIHEAVPPERPADYWEDVDSPETERWRCDWKPDELNPGPGCPYCAGEMCARFDGLGCTHDRRERHG